MSLPPITRNWTFLPNNRISFVSLIDTSSKILYNLKNFLVATMGYTVKYTCDGTTGPTSSSDHTDRWASTANVQTRGTVAGAAQSFAVLTDGNTCDILMTFQGASDDVFKIAFSPGGLYTPAGTANQQPTATDEQSVLAGASVILNTSSLDRVWHVMATTDKKMFRVFIYRAETLTYSFGVEAINPTVATSTNFVASTVGWSSNNQTLTSNAAGHVLGITGSNNAGFARVNSLNATCGGCGEAYQGSIVNPVTTELSAGAIIVGTGFSTTTAGVGGKLGNRIDSWYAYNAVTPGQGDTFGDLTHILFGTGVYPWDGVTFPEIS